jgi:hypothetical protein
MTKTDADVKLKQCLLLFRSFEFIYPVIWKEQVALVVGAAFSRDHYYFAAKSRSHRDFSW